jgi:leucyl aminopeptidase
MLISLSRERLIEVQADWLVVGLFEDQGPNLGELAGTGLAALIAELIAQKELTGSPGELTPIYGPSGFAAKSLLMVGLGTRAKFDEGGAFTAGFTAAKRLAGKPRENVAVGLLETGFAESPGMISALVEGMVVGTRGPGIRKNETNRYPFGKLRLVIPADGAEEYVDTIERGIRRGQVVGEAVNLARDLVNTPPSEKSPRRLAEEIAKVASEAKITFDIWDEAKMRAERFGGLLGVAAGSDQPPAFAILNYREGGDSPVLALVGKGVTFDSGGLSLKPSASMEDMKSDMTGAAVVLATMQAVARLRLPVNLTGYLALTENMTGGSAMKLGDVLTMRNGKTVEVLNTDAEGRLILADALSYAAETKPWRILDLATLTGACLVALGPKVAGLFSNDETFRQAVTKASRQTGERVWGLPLDEDYKEQMKSHVADMKNVGGKWGGAVTAAKFLEQFVDGVPWAHLDIAGPSWSDTDSAGRDAGGTGCFVRTLTALVESSLPSAISPNE